MLTTKNTYIHALLADATDGANGSEHDTSPAGDILIGGSGDDLLLTQVENAWSGTGQDKGEDRLEGNAGTDILGGNSTFKALTAWNLVSNVGGNALSIRYKQSFASGNDCANPLTGGKRKNRDAIYCVSACAYFIEAGYLYGFKVNAMNEDKWRVEA